MHLVDVVLFAHIAVAVFAFAVAGVLHISQFVMRGATSGATLKAWDPVTHRLEPLFPIVALVLFGLGAWLVGLSDGEFSWGDGWVIVAAVGLGAMEAVGGIVLAPHGKRMHQAIVAAGDGPVDAELRAHLVNPAAWGAAFFATSTALGILFLMATKPGAVAAAVIVAACGLAGAGLGVACARGGARVDGYAVVPAAAATAVAGERH